jgi:hypothetical protein
LSNEAKKVKLNFLNCPSDELSTGTKLRILKNQEYKIVSVVWVDSQIASLTWCHIDEIPINIATVTTVGFLVCQTKDIITVASSLSYKENATTQISSVINIPKCCIKSKKIISF